MSPASTPGRKPENTKNPMEEKRVKCQKCGAELRSEQKVCIACGTRTAAGGNFAVEEKEPFQITSSMKKAAAAAGALILILIFALALRVTPPDVIAQKWFNAMASRQILKAQDYHSPEFVQSMQQGLSDSSAISDYIYDELNAKQGKESFGKAIYTPGVPNQASVTVNISYPDGSAQTMEIIFTKIGRRWLIERLVY